MSDPVLRSIFVEALDRETAEERASFLDQACGSDVALREQVALLLEAHDEAGSFFADSSKKVETPLVTKPGKEAAGDRIGRYKLLQQIGEGGCGVVYMADQEEPVRRRVALKIIKLGMDTKQVIARFEAERQALALMDHPNIARVLDAGATGTGRPYFVMELVRGMKITQFCDENKTPTQERLKLFIQVCQAIQHAHLKGIIHRDIKPSNVLVTVNDGVAVPKVIDFGIAKATQGRLTDQTLFTAFEQFIGTPAYMSPEQAVLTSLDVDTRSDIYSLGVLLYELLTGRTPFDQDELLASGLDEMRRTIRESEPQKPSTRLNSLPRAELTTAAQGRQIEAPRLVHLVRGDLDWIVMKCLEKDRGRRYETASGLAADVGRYLNNEPIVARPPSQWYSLQKMAHRNRAALVAAIFIFLALLLAIGVLALSNVRIREKAQKDIALATAQKSREEALKSHAFALRQSRQIGQQLEGLAALREAAGIHKDAELRDAVIATLAVPDLRPGKTWHAYDTNNTAVAFDVNYERYARIDEQNTISVRTVADDQEIQRFSSGPSLKLFGTAFHFSPDSRLLAKFEQKDRWSLWGAEDGKLVLRTAPESSPGIAFSRDSTQVAIVAGGSIVTFELSTGKERKRWPSPYRAWSMEFSPDNRRLAVGTLGTEVVPVYDPENGRLVSEFQVGLGGQKVVTWHHSGRYLAVSANDYIQLWDVKAAAKVSSFQAHAQTVTSLSFDPSGNWLISDSWDGTPRLWQPSPEREWLHFFSGLTQLGFSRNGRWAGVSFPGAGQAQLLEFVPSRIYHTFVGSLLDRQYSFNQAEISPDGRLLALVSKDVSIRELPSGRQLATLPMHPGWLKFHPDGKELIVSELGAGLEIWPIGRDTVAPQKIRLGPPRRVPLAFSPCEFMLARDGRTMAMSVQGSDEARIMDLDTGAVLHSRFPHPSTDSIAFTSDAQFIAAAGWHSTQAQLWNVRTGERLMDLPVERARVTFTPDDRECVVSTSQAYVFYDVATQKVTRRFERQGSMHLGWIAYSHDGKLMAMELSPGVIRLCEVKTGRTIANLQDPNGNMNRWIGFTPDDTQLIVAATYERAIHRWDLRAMRAELKAMDLDWDWPEFPPQSAEAKSPPRLEVEVISSAAP